MAFSGFIEDLIAKSVNREKKDAGCFNRNDPPKTYSQI